MKHSIGGGGLGCGSEEVKTCVQVSISERAGVTNPAGVSTAVTTSHSAVDSAG
jgi:hypothetical protein